MSLDKKENRKGKANVAFILELYMVLGILVALSMN